MFHIRVCQNCDGSSSNKDDACGVSQPRRLTYGTLQLLLYAADEKYAYRPKSSRKSSLTAVLPAEAKAASSIPIMADKNMIWRY